MNGTNSLKSNAVGWIKAEFDTLIASAEQAMANYTAEGAEHAEDLQQSVLDLVQMEKTLTLVDRPGGRLLAGELACDLEFLMAPEKDTSQALDVVPEGLLTLRNYLNHLSLGGEAEPVVLLELLNALRSARGAEPITERDVFFPPIHAVSAPAIQAGHDSKVLIDARAVAAKARPYYEAGLIAWFRGDDEGAGLKKMLAVTARLHITARYGSSRTLWWIGSALLEALLLGAVEPSAEMRTLFGRLDREIKRLIEAGEEQFDAGIPDDLLRGFLYFVAIAKGRGRYVRDVKRAFALERVLPERGSREEQRRRIDGRSSEIQASVAKEVREELQRVRDSLEIRLNGATQSWTAPCPEADRLTQASETLRMIGAQDLSRKIGQTADLLRQWSEQGAPFVDDALTDVAADILSVELELERVSAVSAGPLFGNSVSSEDGADSASSEVLMAPGPDLMASVADLLLEETEALKDAIARRISDPDAQGWSSELPQAVSRIQGAIDVLGASSFRAIVGAIGDYLRAPARGAVSRPDADEIQALAEAVTSIQCYAEILKGEGASDLPGVLRAGQESARRLQGFGESPGCDESSDEAASDAAPGAGQLADPPEVVRELVDHTQGRGTDPGDGVVPSDGTSSSEGQAVQVPDRFRELQVLGAQVDPDILEVFLEEAAEVTQNIGAALASREGAMGDQEALAVMRRSFHTLKGSGRLVGAELLGEFGWVFENLLNKLIEGTLAPRPVHSDLVADAVAWLPEMVQQLESGGPPPAEVYELMAVASAVTDGDDGQAMGWQKKKP